MQEELDSLYKRLGEASRTESRPLKEQISALQRKKNHYQNQLATFDD